jgi:hypothetical protein
VSYELSIAAAYSSRYDSTLGTILLVVLGAAGLAWLGWISIQSLRQAMLLRDLPSDSAGVMDGHRVAIHGQVRVLDPINTPGVGLCLWSRTIVKQLDSVISGLAFGRRRWRTTSDSTALARFVLVVNGQETEIGSPPTEVQGTRSKRIADDPDFLDTLVNEDNYSTTIEWLPVPPMATVIGRLERRGETRVVVEDPELGLFLTPNAPDVAARIETLKGIGGLLVIAVGVIVLLLMLGHR